MRKYGRNSFPGVALVLAAGASRRLGAPKQRIRYRGETLLGRSVRVAGMVAEGGVCVVVGYRAPFMRRVLRKGGRPPRQVRTVWNLQRVRLPDIRVPRRVRTVWNPRWREGMGRSLAAGIRAVGADARAVLVCLGDQPGVEAEDLRALARVWRARPRCVVAARYGGAPGVPAIFPRSWFRRLGRLSGDRGARAMLASASEVASVPMPRAAFDLDSPEDLARLSRVQ